jgi:hypothetical protein
MNPNFFKSTVVEDRIAKLLRDAPNAGADGLMRASGRSRKVPVDQRCLNSRAGALRYLG